jgi:hypothetical protein
MKDRHTALHYTTHHRLRIISAYYYTTIHHTTLHYTTHYTTHSSAVHLPLGHEGQLCVGHRVTLRVQTHELPQQLCPGARRAPNQHQAAHELLIGSMCDERVCVSECKSNE